jgi:preprotein translocase subunit SecG
MTSTLLIIQIVLALAITIAVLLQKSSSIGLGAYSGSNESVFGAKGPTGFLAKLTFTLAFAFIVNTLALGYLYTSANTSSVADTIIPENNAVVPAAPKQEQSAPAAPVTEMTVPQNDTETVEEQTTPEKETPSAMVEEAVVPATNVETEAKISVQEENTSSAPAVN